jgi:hypothetical protein
VLTIACGDSVLAWNIDAHGRVAQTVLMENPAVEPSCLVFDATGAMIAIATGTTITVQQVERREVYATLEAHIARVRVHLCSVATADVDFRSSSIPASDWLRRRAVPGDEVRVPSDPPSPSVHCVWGSDIQGLSICFKTSLHLLAVLLERDLHGLLLWFEKIWDLGARVLRFQSAVLSAFAILSMAMNPVTGDAAFGFADGTIKIFTVEDDGRFARQLVALDAGAYIRKSANQAQVNASRLDRSTGSRNSQLMWMSHHVFRKTTVGLRLLAVHCPLGHRPAQRLTSQPSLPTN